ncbi:hypothetical protein T492DRAFT_848039 [Pavlovales sp. CCMP2436]|nr:hypothetical protein T492DRAFT_848039 [Pavlovales sp. CCMP2436]
MPPQPSGVPASLWTRGRAQPPPSAPFEPGDGLDLYIDAIFGLPDCIAAVRVEACVGTLSGGRVPLTSAGGASSLRAEPRPSADALSPRLDLRLELREARFDPTATLYLTAVGLDARTRQPVLVGRAAFALFCKLDEVAGAGERPAREQPATTSERYFAANLGCFQARLYSDRGSPAPPPPGTGPGVSKMLNGGRPLPAASILLRLLPAPQTADGLGLLSAEDVPADKHESLGLRVRAPEYASGAYDSALATPTPAELTLLRARARERGAKADTVRDRLRAASQAAGSAPAPSASASESELQKWASDLLDSAFDSRVPPKPMPFNWGFPFSRTRGVAVVIVGANNLPNAYLSAALVSLAPPGGPYRKPPQFDASVHLVSALQPASDLRSPKWDTPPHVFRAEAFPGLADSDDDVFNLPHLALVIDVRCLSKPSAPGARAAEHQGWAVLPLFCGAGYVASGVHRLPLYLAQTGGEPSPALLEQIATEGARGVLAKARADRRVKLVEGASVDVAVLDELRAGEWDNGALPAPDVSALAEATGGKPDKYSNPRASKPCQTLLSATVTEASLRAKFELALGFNGR